MANNWLLAITPVLGLVANMCVQIAIARGARRVGASIVGGFLAGLAMTIYLAVFSNESEIPASALAALAVALATYVSLSYGYWTFLNMNITSLRIRMIREIRSSTTGISYDDLIAQYSPDELLKRRLERMERAGKFSRVGDRWLLHSHLLNAIATFIDFLRAIMMPSPTKTGER